MVGTDVNLLGFSIRLQHEAVPPVTDSPPIPATVDRRTNLKGMIKMTQMFPSRGMTAFRSLTPALALILAISASSFVMAQSPQVAQNAQSQSPVRLANREIPGRTDMAPSNEHPLMPVLRWAEAGRPEVMKIKDYTAQVTKQENINGELQEAQVMDLKLRHEPFSVYLKFRYPRSLVGQEAIYVKGGGGPNDGKLVAHGVGMQKAFGTQFLDPEGLLAMRGNKYPITKMGILNLLDELVEVGGLDTKYGECDVRYYKDVKIEERLHTLIEVTHPVSRSSFRFHKARIFVDNEHQIPTRYESYDWPKAEGEKPMLLEAYSYKNLKFNVGLTDADFDHRNPEYGYRESGKAK